MESLEKGIDNLVSQAISITYYMRGAVQFEEIFERSYYERQKMADFIKKHLESEQNKVKETKGKLNAIY